MYKFNIIDKLSLLFVIIGAINWGLFGLFNFNLVAAIFNLFGDASSILQRIIYILVGVAGVNLSYLIYKTKFKQMK